MKFRGHPFRGAIFGFLTFLFIGLDLLFLGVVPLDSAVLTVLPIVGIVFGLVWAYLAPLRRAPKGAPPPA
jgi:putative flippase GtrA